MFREGLQSHVLDKDTMEVTFGKVKDANGALDLKTPHRHDDSSRSRGRGKVAKKMLIASEFAMLFISSRGPPTLHS